jgi:hypothetical protein
MPHEIRPCFLAMVMLPGRGHAWFLFLRFHGFVFVLMVGAPPTIFSLPNQNEGN